MSCVKAIRPSVYVHSRWGKASLDFSSGQRDYCGRGGVVNWSEIYEWLLFNKTCCREECQVQWNSSTGTRHSVTHRTTYHHRRNLRLLRISLWHQTPKPSFEILGTSLKVRVVNLRNAVVFKFHAIVPNCVMTKRIRQLLLTKWVDVRVPSSCYSPWPGQVCLFRSWCDCSCQLRAGQLFGKCRVKLTRSRPFILCKSDIQATIF